MSAWFFTLVRTLPCVRGFPVVFHRDTLWNAVHTQVDLVPLRRKCASVESISWNDARGSSNFLISMQFPWNCAVLLNKNFVIGLDGGNGS